LDLQKTHLPTHLPALRPNHSPNCQAYLISRPSHLHPSFSSTHQQHPLDKLHQPTISLDTYPSKHRSRHLQWLAPSKLPVR
jgi:hypothetical protein